MQHQSGNVLFLILIVVALFAALCYAVSSSNRNSGNSISKDTAKANAAAIIQYGSSLRAAVTRMKITNNCSDTTLDFSNNIYTLNSGSYINILNPDSPSSGVCSLFNPAGGNSSPILWNPSILDLNGPNANVSGAAKPGHGVFRVVQIQGIGTDAPGVEASNDIVFWVPHINDQTCLAINDSLGIVNPNGQLPVIDDNGGAHGLYVAPSQLAATVVFSGNQINGQPTFCAKSSTNSVVRYFQVLIER